MYLLAPYAHKASVGMSVYACILVSVPIQSIFFSSAFACTLYAHRTHLQLHCVCFLKVPSPSFLFFVSSCGQLSPPSIIITFRLISSYLVSVLFI
jgi:hypothetical protein